MATQIVNCILENGLEKKIRRSIEGVLVEYSPSQDEINSFEDALAELSDVDNEDNNLWYITSETPVENDTITYVSPNVSVNAIYSKGVFCTDPIIFPTASVSLLQAVEAVYTVNFEEVNINLFIKYSIKQLDATNFKIEVSVIDLLEEVEDIDIIFDNELNTGLPEPVPSTFTLPDKTIISPASKVFSKSDLTFPSNPAGAVDQVYTLVIAFKDSLGALIVNEEVDIIVEGLNIA